MKKKTLLKKLIGPVIIPITKRYLQRERNTTFLGIRLSVPVGVFHPSLFFSTTTMGLWLQKQTLKNKKILEIGCGSGAISILAAKQNAIVTCCDINPDAVKVSLKNAEKNEVKISCFTSNLFEKIEKQKFDLILNNPPYYPKNPLSMEEHAWYAGENFEYFIELFKQSKAFLAPGGSLLLVLSDECNTDVMNEIANNMGFDYQIIYQRIKFIEKTFIIQYKIKG